jgi:hypothetical protein
MATQALTPPLPQTIGGRIWSSCLVVLYVILALAPLAFVGYH